jgi:hypothetical protein
MQVKLKNGEIDICIGAMTLSFWGVRLLNKGIALTDALIAGLANGLDSYKLVGRYIGSPLRW